MKKILLLLIFFSGYRIAMTQEVNGVYQDSTSTSFKNCYAIFATVGDSIFMTHYLEFEGQPFVEYGKGIIKGDELIYQVVVTKGIPGWSSAGTHRLKIEEDGKVLRGTYSDNLGNTGALIFTRRFEN